MKRLTTAIKWFAYGLGVALLFAPRSGRETRQQIMQWAGNYLSGALNTASQTVDQAAAKTQQVVGQAAERSSDLSDTLNQASYNVQESTQSGSSTFGSGPA
ncbi:MAG: YtxH domain-containing protein [Chloroflexota bacterium]|nr:YtxH domain-containing protein [Chloroflexota bacterium]